MSVRAAQAIEFQFECKLPNGLHARPASHLAELANRFVSNCSLINLRTGAQADIKSVLAAIAADIRPGEACSLRIEGPDQTAALDTLRRFVEEELPACDEPLAEAVREAAAPKLPRGLSHSTARYLFGLAVSRGAGNGKAVVLGRMALTSDFAGPAGDRAAEHELARRGFHGVRARVERLLTQNGLGAEAAILKAHLAILSDVTLQGEIDRRIELGRSAAQAILEAGEHFGGLLERAESAYIRERAIDVKELCTELLDEIYGSRFQPAAIELTEPATVIAETLAPHQLLALDRRFLRGIVLESAGATSHAVILARSLGVPAVVGIANATRLLAPGDETIVDGDRGLVFPDPPAAVQRFYHREGVAAEQRRASLAEFASAPAETLDGERIEIGANISSAEEASGAFSSGADGVGLFRTELFLARASRLPSEDEQFEAYRAAARAAGGRPVILRTADIGGDKSLPYLELPEERNPFLGYRGIRIYPEFRELLGAQIRAALRASAEGVVWLMAPMVASLEEARWFKSEVARAKHELRARDAAFNEAMPLGAMIEIPSAAYLMEHLARELDFFSIGANDLSQYFYAADRENSKISGLANVRGPAFLALLDHIVKKARAAGKWIGLCGEMGGDARNLSLLIGLGLNEISVSANAIPALKRCAARLSAAECWELVSRAMTCGTAAEVEAILDSFGPTRAALPLLAPNLVMLRSDSRDKDEAIREIVEALHAEGRVQDRDRMEDAVWTRESVYSTGLGHGFAVPHCHSAAVNANSIGILRLDQPIEWGSLDGQPVRIIILLALSEANRDRAHMKIFSRLARKLMNEDFRARLMEIEDPGEMVSHVGSELEESI